MGGGLRLASCSSVLLALALPCAAAAAPVSGPHEVVESRFTTTVPGAPTGFHYTGRYHAAGDPSGDPPYMRRMVSYPPPGLRFDTGAVERCTATDLELALRGPDACPPGSRLGGGTAEGRFMGMPSTLQLDMFNNTNEQILVARTPFVATVARGTIHPDQSVDFASPTCYPALNPPGCPADTALQLGSDVSLPVMTRGSRSYMTTPPACPPSGRWETPVRFWWADGTVDTVVTEQPCERARPAASAKPRPAKSRPRPAKSRPRPGSRRARGKRAQSSWAPGRATPRG